MATQSPSTKPWLDSDSDDDGCLLLKPVVIAEWGLVVLRDHFEPLSALEPFAADVLLRKNYTIGPGFIYAADNSK